MVRMPETLFMVSLLLPLLSMPVAAQGPHHGPRFGPGPPHGRPPPPPIPTGIWMDEEIVARLALTESQVDALRALDQTFHEDGFQIRLELDELHKSLECAFREDPVDRKRVETLAAEIESRQTRRFTLHIEARLGVHEILSRDQIDTLKTMMRPRHQRMNP